MKGIKFNRFKKKSLILLHEVLNNETTLKGIKNRKILQTLETLHLNHGIVEERTLKERTLCLFKLNKYQILIFMYTNNKMKIWDVVTTSIL